MPCIFITLHCGVRNATAAHCYEQSTGLFITGRELRRDGCSLRWRQAFHIGLHRGRRGTDLLGDTGVGPTLIGQLAHLGTAIGTSLIDGSRLGSP